jgi:hypothetical protein
MKTNVTGRLVDEYGAAIRDEMVVLSYTFGGAPDWVPIISDMTDAAGNYSITWIPTATGYYILKTEWTGNETYAAANRTVTFSSLFHKNQYVFTIESNSSTSQASFNETRLSLRFMVTGLSGTNGYSRVTIAKGMISNASKAMVYVDSVQTSFTAAGDSWLLESSILTAVTRS